MTKMGTSSNCNAVTQNVSQTQSNQLSNIVTGDDRWFHYIEPVNKLETKFCELLIVEGLFLPKRTLSTTKVLVSKVKSDTGKFSRYVILKSSRDIIIMIDVPCQD